MKHGTDAKLKFKQLCNVLSLPAWQAKGLLQSVWDFAMDNAPAGDIGRYADEDIALGIGYEGNVVALIKALVDTHWLDRDDEFRLVVHDWQDHAEDWLKKRMQRGNHKFVTQVIRDRNGGQRQTAADTPPPMSDNGGLPSQAKASPAEPRQHQRQGVAAGGGGGSGDGREERIRFLMLKPAWYTGAAPWFDRPTAEEMADLPVSDEVIATTIKVAGRKRKREGVPRGIDNPVGYIIAELRKAAAEPSSPAPAGGTTA